ncbi:hypothetical protein LSUE1_G002023 [Lachnellula suecica]|uniref:Metallo-beta-lactamase domain-containing protein n=1 Tax=Lachnellula suecica TaxID=602035 RepID=A0A8T9CEB7_9HELO|nr:hypothetical protein LSUE1_G002023 [Lachnellula suecica]
MADSLPSTSFVSRRVNASTFLVIEDDSYGEQPYVYVKVYSNHLIITDTGCNNPRSKNRSLTSLRQYLETYPLSSDNHRVLNPNGAKKYVVLCSHCHYDHILGITQFLSAEPTIVASGFDKLFLLKDLPQHSLCKYVDTPTPNYTVSHWARHLEFFTLADTPFRIQFFYIPGHTPDSLAWYDTDEHHLYVGDTFYERKSGTEIPELPKDAGQASQGAIIFPEDGNWIQFMSSLEILLSFVDHQNGELRRQHGLSHGSAPRVKVGCGHLTYDGDAEQMILEVRALFGRIIAGKVPVTSTSEKRGVLTDFWLEDDDSRYSVVAPRHIAEEARKHFHSNNQE